jgi:hypothetical protein
MCVGRIEVIKWLKGKSTNSGDRWKLRFTNSLAIDTEPSQDWIEHVYLPY